VERRILSDPYGQLLVFKCLSMSPHGGWKENDQERKPVAMGDVENRRDP
jgi:hypothetical protein